MKVSTVIKYLLGFFKWESPSILGTVRFRLACLMFIALATFDTGSGRKGFGCSPEVDDRLTRRCFSKYSADMSSFLDPKAIVWMTGLALFVSWTVMNLCSEKHLEEIRRSTCHREREQLCYEFWKNFLHHVSVEALVIIVILTFFYCTQEISLPETYKCSLTNASEQIVLTCEDMHHWDKSNLNLVFLGGMVVLTALCIATIFHAICGKEHFIKDLLNLTTKDKKADDDDNHHRNTPRSANVNNHNEQQDAPVRRMRRNMDTAQVPDAVFLDVAENISYDWKQLGGRLSISQSVLNRIDVDCPCVLEKTMTMLHAWKQTLGKEATFQVLRKALDEIKRGDLSERVKDKMLALAEVHLPPTEGGLDPSSIETGSS